MITDEKWDPCPHKVFSGFKTKQKKFLKVFFPQSILFTYLLRPPLHKLGIFSLAEAGKEKQEFFRAHYLSFFFFFFFWYLIILIGLSWKWRKISVKNKLQFRIFFIAFVHIVIFVSVLCIQKMSSGSVRRVSCQDIQVVSFSDWIFFFSIKK